MKNKLFLIGSGLLILSSLYVVDKFFYSIPDIGYGILSILGLGLVLAGWLKVSLCKMVFGIMGIIFGVLVMLDFMSGEAGLPMMFIFLGLSLSANAKECYDKGSQKDAMVFLGVAIFLYVVTAYNLISRLI